VTLRSSSRNFSVNILLLSPEGSGEARRVRQVLVQIACSMVTVWTMFPMRAFFRVLTYTPTLSNRSQLEIMA
jgi:hypothetical protein